MYLVIYKLYSCLIYPMIISNYYYFIVFCHESYNKEGNVGIYV